MDTFIKKFNSKLDRNFTKVIHIGTKYSSDIGFCGFIFRESFIDTQNILQFTTAFITSYQDIFETRMVVVNNYAPAIPQKIKVRTDIIKTLLALNIVLKQGDPLCGVLPDIYRDKRCLDVLETMKIQRVSERLKGVK